MPTIGRATIDVNYDGKDLPAQARKIGKEAGAEFGEEFSKAYPQKIDEGFKKDANRFQKEGEKGGRTYGKAFSGGVSRDLDQLAEKVTAVFRDKDGLENYRKGLFGVRRETGQVTKTTTVLRGEIDQLRRAGRLGDVSMKSLTDRLTEMGREERSIETKHINELFRSSREAMEQQDRWAEKSAHFVETQRMIKDALRDQAADIKENARLQKEGEARARGMAQASQELDNVMRRLSPHLKLSNDELERFKRIPGGGTEGDIRRLARTAEGLGNNLEGLGKKALRAGTLSEKLGPIFGKIARSMQGFDPTDNPGQLFALLLALAPQVAVLANAAAGGILILAGAIAALGAAGVGYGFVFSNLFGDLKKIDPAIRPAAKALQDFKKTFGDLRLDLQKQVLSPAVVSQFEQFSSKLAGTLQSGFAKIGPALQTVLLGVSRDLNSSGFKKDFDALFASFAPTIKSFGGVLRNTFGIVGQLLTEAAPYVQDFVGELDIATGKFLAFLRSPEGKKSIKDFLDGATRTLKDVGDAAVVVGAALVKLITPKNIESTGRVLKSLGDAVPGLLRLADALNEVVPALAGVVEGIGREAGQIGQAFEDVFTNTDTIVTGFGVFFHGIGTAVDVFIQSLQHKFQAIGAAVKAAMSGDFAGAARALGDGFKTAQTDAKRFGDAIASANGDAAATFRTLDSKAQTSLSAMASRFQVPQSKAQEFGGEITRLAKGAGIDISKIATAKSWDDIQRITGATGTTVARLRDRFGELPAVKSTKVEAEGADKATTSVKNLDKEIRSLKGKLVEAKEQGAGESSERVQYLKRKIAELQGKKIDVKEQGADASAQRARILKEKVDALKAKTIQVNETGSAASAQRAAELKNKVDALKAKTIQVAESGASGSSGRVDTLRGKIRDLTGKTVNVAANVAGAGAVGALAGAIAGLHDKTVNVQTIQSKRNANRFGGIMKGGQQIAGGERMKNGALAFAKGGILRRPTFFGNVLAGEAGPEAIVPLSGALSRVDRSVRDLSAIARGRYAPPQQAGGSSRTVHVNEGAVQVISQGLNERQVGNAVMDRLEQALGV